MSVSQSTDRRMAMSIATQMAPSLHHSPASAKKMRAKYDVRSRIISEGVFTPHVSALVTVASIDPLPVIAILDGIAGLPAAEKALRVELAGRISRWAITTLFWGDIDAWSRAATHIPRSILEDTIECVTTATSAREAIDLLSVFTEPCPSNATEVLLRVHAVIEHKVLN